MVDDASCHLSCYTSTHASIHHRYKDKAPQIIDVSKKFELMLTKRAKAYSSSGSII